MSTAYDLLAEDQWAPKIPNTKALDFLGTKLPKQNMVTKETERPVWTHEHMKCLFSSPITVLRDRVLCRPTLRLATTSAKGGRRLSPGENPAACARARACI